MKHRLAVLSDHRHQNSPIHVSDSSLIEQPLVGDGDLAVLRDVPKHVEQHPMAGWGSVVVEANLRK